MIRRRANSHIVRIRQALEGMTQRYVTHATLAKVSNAPESSIRRIATLLVSEGLLRRVESGCFERAGVPVEGQALAWTLPAVEAGGTSHYAYATAMATHGHVGAVPEHRLFLRTSGQYRPRVLLDGVQLIRTTAGFGRKPQLVQGHHAKLGQILVTSSLETALDGLDRPGWCGGFAEVARFIATQHAQWTDEHLREAWKEHPPRLVRRLGYLIERTGRALPDALAPMEPGRQRFHLLAADHERSGAGDLRWRIRVNVAV